MTNFSGKNLNVACDGPKGGGMDSRRNALEQAIPEGYKGTELGDIPIDWDTKELGEVCSLKSGLGITAKDINSSNAYPCYGGNGLRGYTKSFTHEGDFALIGRQGALCGNIQYATGKFFASEHALVASPNRGVNAKWLAIYLERMNLNQYSESSAQPGLSAEKLRVLKLITPLPKEQTAIANALSDVDALLTELEKLIAKKQAIKTATMQQLLTGKTRLPQFATYTEGAVEGKRKSTKSSELGEIPEDWDVRNLGYLLEENRIPSGLYKDKNLYGTGTAIIKLGDVFKNDSFNPDIVQRVKTTNIENKAYSAKIGDLIIALASVKLEGVGKVMIIKELSEPTVYDHNVALIRFKKNCNSNFMSFLFKSNYIRSLVASRATQVGTTFLKTSTILEFPILLPSPEEQTAIATILSDMDNEIQTLEQRLAKTRQIKQGMMQQLLTGRTRLPFKKLETEQDGGS